MQDEFGEKLKALRKGRRLTREKLAAQLGISARQLQRYEEGDSKPEVDGIRRLSEALGYDFAPHFFKTLDVSFQSTPDGMITMPARERIEELLNDKKVLQESIAANLQTIQVSQQVILSTMTENHRVMLAALDLLQPSAESRMKSSDRTDGLGTKASSRDRKN